MTHQEFIDTLVPLITKYCKQYNFPFVSPILAQAILESNWGTSYKAVAGLNFFGLKYTTAQRVPSASGLFLDGGSEQKTDGTYVPLSSKTAWCKFTSYDNGVHGYFEFLTNGGGRYDNLKLAVSPKDYLEKIKAANYATSLDYVVNLMKVINTNNLTQYDKYTIDNNIKKKNIMDNINIFKHTNTHNLTA
ncbi:MAG: glucosaminidase domain-containing protein, partial [Bacilli bacterium]|nr:glucosaminidase domain-containing protein [Bacilli bacterium]